MEGMRTDWILVGGLLSAVLAMGEVKLNEERVFTGMCDASAAVALDEDHFLVSDDETTALRTYSLKNPGVPVRVLELASFLRVDPKKPETDVEGAARVGDVVYWIGSHGRNKNGKRRESRERFFAVKVDAAGQVAPFGAPYEDLVKDITRAPQLRKYNLADASRRAPKDEGAFNIEGLAAGEAGTLLIGLRNPIPHGRAVVVPLLNPAELISGDKKVQARFGEPIEIDLGGDGVRSIMGEPGDYHIAAGAYDGADRASLWKWDGQSAPVKIWSAPRGSSANLEALIEMPSAKGRQMLALSDDGGVEVNGVECKDLPPHQRSFRAFVVELE